MKSNSVNAGRFRHRFRFTLFFIGLLQISVAWAVNAPVSAPTELKPTTEQNSTAVAIMRELKYHYKRMPV
ncbi:MAG TPA: hypothetical protein VFM46_10655, partial [Pseudomonadales bacterium]|nr:hypothetical protein [Pseudomonadales bacterium]